MKRRAFKWIKWVLAVASAALLMGCGADRAPVQGMADQADSVQEITEQPEKETAEAEQPKEAEDRENGSENQAVSLADGSYTVTFDTDSSMFHLNESCGGRTSLTVADGVMTVHIPLVSKSIVNLFPGTAEEARAAGEPGWLKPVAETVTYSDGYTEEVYAFDVPVPAIGVEFELALIGTKGKWYDHMVCVADPRPAEGEARSPESGDVGASGAGGEEKPQTALENGTYNVEVTLVGGTGRAELVSPAKLTVSDGGMVARIMWSSPYYDYMTVGNVKYEPVNAEGNSVFEIPVAALDAEIPVTADTVAMSTPHEICYTLLFDSASAKPAE